MKSGSATTCKYCSSALTSDMSFGETTICGTCGMEQSETKVKATSKKPIAITVAVLVLGLGFYLRNEIMMGISPALAIKTMSLEQVKTIHQKCLVVNNSKCLLETYHRLSEEEPENPIYKANYAFLLTATKKFKEADVIYKSFIEQGTATYDLMAYYAQNFEGLGQNAEAIKWYEKSLELNPRLIDVTKDLARLYTKDKRTLEAISLMRSFTQQFPEAEGQLAGDMSAMMEQINQADLKTLSQIKLLSVGSGHFNIPISLKPSALPKLFLMDTGASNVLLPTADIEESYPELMRTATISHGQLANGQIIEMKNIIVPELQIGPWVFKNITVAYCDNCDRLAGMSLLKNFKMETSAKGNLFSVVLSN